MNLGMRIEAGFALLAATLINVNGGYKGGKSAGLSDFMPHADKVDQSSVDGAFKSLRGKN